MKKFKEYLGEAFFKVRIPDVAPTFVEADSASKVKMNMRKILKPDVVKELEIERVTPAKMKQMYRDMAKGKDGEEETSESTVVKESSEIDKVVARIFDLKNTLRKRQREAGGPGEMSDTDWEADQEERIDDAEKKLRDLKAAGHKVKSIGSGPRTASGRSDVGGPGVRENVKGA